MIILDTWRTSAFGLVRILFGMVWAIDAYFKWQPSFVKGFSTYLMGALPGQPAPVRAWIGLDFGWILFKLTRCFLPALWRSAKPTSYLEPPRQLCWLSGGWLAPISGGDNCHLVKHG